MAIPPLTTILNNAPLIIQGANKLIKILREKDHVENTEDEFSNTPNDITEELKKINMRLDNTDDSNIQQIQLIEELAKQNESLAGSLHTTIKRQNIVFLIAIVAIVISGISILKIFGMI